MGDFLTLHMSPASALISLIAFFFLPCLFLFVKVMNYLLVTLESITLAEYQLAIRDELVQGQP